MFRIVPGVHRRAPRGLRSAPNTLTQQDAWEAPVDQPEQSWSGRLKTRIMHHGPVLRGPGANFGSKIGPTPGRAALIGGSILPLNLSHGLSERVIASLHFTPLGASHGGGKRGPQLSVFAGEIRT